MWERATTLAAGEGTLRRFFFASWPVLGDSAGGDLVVADLKGSESGDFGILEPTEVSGGDPFLGVLWEVGEQGVAALRVEFSEDVVHEEDGSFWGVLGEDFPLGEFEGEGDGSLLALGGKVGGREAVDADGEFIAVGADDGLSCGGLAVPGLKDGVFEGGAGGGEVLEAECLVFAGDGELCGGGEGGEIGDELGASVGEVGAVLDEDFLVGDELGKAESGFFEEEVFGFEGAPVATVGGAVGGVELGADKVQETSACFAGAPNEIEIFISHPDDESALGEVGGVGRAGFPVDVKGEGVVEVLDFAVLLPWICGDAESRGGDSGEGLEAVGARGVEADEGANGFEDGGFSLCVVADEDGSLRRDFDGEVLKAAEVPQAEVGEHAGLWNVAWKTSNLKFSKRSWSLGLWGCFGVVD